MTTRTRRRRSHLRYIHRIRMKPGRVNPSLGWQVRMRDLDVNKYFGDRQYGGVLRALRAALAFRDRQQLELWRPNR